MVDLALSGSVEPDALNTNAADRIARRLFTAEALHGIAVYHDLKAEWQALAERQQAATIFQSPDLLESWAGHFADGDDSAVVTIIVREKGRAVLIWPLLLERNALIRIARGAGAPIGQYDEILLDPDCDRDEAFAAAKQALAKTVRPHVILLERVRADGALHALLQSEVPLERDEAAPYADLSAGIAAFMKQLKPRVVRQQRKRVRRFEQEGNVGFAVADSPEQAERWLAEAMALKHEWLRSTGRFSRAFLKSETFECLADLARSLSVPDASPRMVVSRLTLDGRTAALEMGFCQRGTYHLYLGAFAPDAAKFGPGNVLTEKLLGWCVANGIARYDMLAPRTRNKAEWQSGEVGVFDYALPTTARGRLYVAGYLRRLVPAIRNAFYSLPDPVRAKLAGFALRNLVKTESPAPTGGT